MNLSNFTNFQQRFFLSFLGIAYLTVVILFSHLAPFQYLFVLTLAIVQAQALSEYYCLSAVKGYQPLKTLPIGLSVFYVLMEYMYGPEQIGLLGIFVFTAICFIAFFKRHEHSISNLAITLFGFIYITIPLSFLIDINFQAQAIWLVFLLITTKITDTAAYFTGKLIGHHLLAPTLSPKKTLEGAAAGLAGSIVASCIFYAFSSIGFMITLTEAIILGASIGIISQIGDLAESLFKRDAQVKDSSTLPGFGGMLDVVDSLIFTTPLLYFWLRAKDIL